ncbi:MAG: pyruvate kinase [Chloroflexi bacterium RBG_13_46_14]|nr:MAG: pyruvate kinase [Chloroflexi bacterium RBG_13_46_14]
MRIHSKIVCTLGPASSSPEIIENMLKAGMDVARLNLSYGNFEEHTRTISIIRSVSERLGEPAGIMLDLPGYKRRTGGIVEVFRDHLEFASEQDVDFIALSFITSAEQVSEIRDLLNTIDPDIPLIVKIEQEKALENSKGIIEVSDGIMVARGDLALEISIEKVPLAQKRLIRESNQRGKPVITATQMLESMVRFSSPTRAEATDVTNAVLDGSDAIMLSEETAIGNFPVEAVAMMNRIAMEAETAFPYYQVLESGSYGLLPEVDDATARAACQIAHQIDAKAIITFTSGGTTALRVSKYRPKQSIIAVTPSQKVVNRLTLPWGVVPVKKRESDELEDAFELAKQSALETGIVKIGDLIVITAGIPLRVPGQTNLLKVERV